MIMRNETRRESSYFFIREAVRLCAAGTRQNSYTHLEVAYINHIIKTKISTP